jgi:predicted amidophosphoribosyltransferase
MPDAPDLCIVCDERPATDLLFCDVCIHVVTSDPNFCRACVEAYMHNSPFCDACWVQVAQEIRENLRAHVQATNGPCITCCEERPVYEGLFCAACYANALIDP